MSPSTSLRVRPSTSLRARARREGTLFVLSSPSGGGKTTVVRHLLQRMPELVRSVSISTRAPRAGERAGVDYRFVTPAAFERLRRAGEFLEWARVHQARYGTPRRAVDAIVRRGRDVVLSIDVQGARQIRRRFGGRAVLVFLMPPSIEALKRRLISRQTDSRSAIARRIEAARREMACARWYDYVIVNDVLARAVDEAAAIVTAERLRTAARPRNGGWR